MDECIINKVNWITTWPPLQRQKGSWERRVMWISPHWCLSRTKCSSTLTWKTHDTTNTWLYFLYHYGHSDSSVLQEQWRMPCKVQLALMWFYFESVKFILVSSKTRQVLEIFFYQPILTEQSSIKTSRNVPKMNPAGSKEMYAKQQLLDFVQKCRLQQLMFCQKQRTAEANFRNRVEQQNLQQKKLEEENKVRMRSLRCEYELSKYSDLGRPSVRGAIPARQAPLSARWHQSLPQPAIFNQQNGDPVLQQQTNNNHSHS